MDVVHELPLIDKGPVVVAAELFQHQTSADFFWPNSASPSGDNQSSQFSTRKPGTRSKSFGWRTREVRG